MLKKLCMLILIGLFVFPVFSENIFADKGYKLNEKGNKEYLNKNYKSAVNNYIRALSEREDPIIKYNLANSLYQMKDYDKAIDVYKKIEKEVPDSVKPDLYYNLGNAYFQKKQYDKAVKSYVNCLKMKPKDKYAKENLELALKMLKQQKQKKNKKNDKSDKNKEKNKNQKDKEKNKDKKKNKKNKQQQKEKQKNEQNKKEEQKKKELKKLLKTLAEQEKIDRKKNMKNKKKQKAIIDRMEKDW